MSSIGTVLVLLSFAVATSAGATTVQLDAYFDNSIRVRITQPDGMLADPIISALGAPPASGGSSTSSLTNGNLHVAIDPKSQLLTARRVSDGAVLLTQTAPVTWGAATAHAKRKNSKSASISFAGLGAKESVYGLGEHRNSAVAAPLPYHKVFADSLFYGYSQGSDVSIPWFMSNLGWGFVWNSPALGSVSLGADAQTWVANATLNVDFWITTSPAGATTAEVLPSLLRQYASAIGPPMQLPFWATGFIQCKDRYRNQTQLLDVARGYVQRGLPISMIVIDWFHWRQMGDWSLNPRCWPQPQAMVDELRSLGIELMITAWPFMGMPYDNGTATSDHWKEFHANGWLANSTVSYKPESIWQYATPTGNALVDATNPAAMEAVGKHWYEGYGQYGVKAVWMDEAEPDHNKYIAGPEWMLDAGVAGEVLPAWVKYWSGGFARNLRKLHGDDYFILSRNAWAGTASQGAALWSGDIPSTFPSLAQQVKAGQSVAMSGIPLWTTDIGGYAGGNPDDPSFQQLIVRWFQFGAFCPLFRLHGHRGGASAPPADECGPTNGDNEVWNLARTPAAYDAIVAVMRLREQLRDYVWRLSQEATATGLPPMRPMALAFPEDAVCRQNGAEAQFMLGNDWLVAPVTEENATSWSVYLPALDKGARWVYHWNSTVIAAEAGWRSVDTTALADFPLFSRRPAD